MKGTVRNLSRTARPLGNARMAENRQRVATKTRAFVDFSNLDDLPITQNDPEQVAERAVDPDRTASAGAEDFSYMLQGRPGAFMFLGNGNSAALHNQAYYFDDAALPYGGANFVALKEQELPLVG